MGYVVLGASAGARRVCGVYLVLVYMRKRLAGMRPARAGTEADG